MAEFQEVGRWGEGCCREECYQEENPEEEDRSEDQEETPCC